MDRQARVFSVTDNVPGEIARAASGQVAQGRYVLVLEHGCVKPDYSRLKPHALHALDAMMESEYLKFIKGVETLRGMSMQDFKAHIRRSFPQ